MTRAKANLHSWKMNENDENLAPTGMRSNKSNQVGRISITVINNTLLPIGSEQREGGVLQHKVVVTEIMVFNTVDLSNFDVRTMVVIEFV